MSLVSTETVAMDNLIAGPSDVIKQAVVVAAGEGVLTRGAVLGKCTSGPATGKYKHVDSTASDGSQNPDAILLEASIDATSADVTASVLVAGEVNENELTFGGYDTADDHRAALRDKGIILRASVDID